MNPDRFGYPVIPFKLGDREPRKDIEKWRINRSRARSMGKVTYLHTKESKCCKSLVRRVYDNSCFECYKGKSK